MALVVGFVLLNATVNFVAPGVKLLPTSAPAATSLPQPEAGAEWDASSTSFPVCGMALLAAAGMLAHGRTSKVARKALHGIKFPYSIQKDSYADLEFQNDIGCSASRILEAGMT